MFDLDGFSHALMIIIGIIMYIFGFIGNLLNIRVFIRWSRSNLTVNEQNRTGNSSLYLLTTSIANLILIFYPLLVRILVDGYQHLVTDSNDFLLCKFRYYILQTSLIISLICVCMATFDRYLITSRSVHLRQLSTTRRTTIRIILFIIVVSSLHSIPIGIYYVKSIVGDCIIISSSYSNYYLYFVIVFFYGIFPICFLSIFGLLTYKQIQSIQRTTSSNRHTNIDKQISQMILCQCVALVSSYIPYCIQHIYFAKFVDKTIYPSGFNLLFRIITIILFYVNPVTSFYIFCLSTPNFRKEVKKILCFRRLNQRNQIRTLTVEAQHH